MSGCGTDQYTHVMGSADGGERSLLFRPVCHTNAMLLYLVVGVVSFHRLYLMSPKSTNDPGP